MPSTQKDELKIFTPVGMMGYGFDETIFWNTIRNGVDAIILDSGSTDSGPSKLALGITSCPRASYVREMELFLAAAHSFKIPIIIASAGGDGTNAHVDLYINIIEEIITRRKFRSMNVVKIYSDIPKDHVHQEFNKGVIKPCGDAVPALTSTDIDDPPQIVAQMGLEPFVKAMEEHPDFDIIVAGRSYDPSPYAAFCVYKGFDDLGLAYHMGKIMECGALCAVPKSREALAIIRRDSFDIVPANPLARCTAISVGAHTLYEKTRPDILKGPGGELHLEDSTYEQLADNRTVRVRGAKFIPEAPGQYTVKLEAARTAGYHSVFFGGFADPILIAQIESFVEGIKAHVASLCKFNYDLKLTTYGKEDQISMFPTTTKIDSNPKSMAICGESRAKTQDQANQVVNVARIACMHGAYPGQKATSGNFGMVCAPFDIPMGQVCEFCIYHIMPVADPVSLFPFYCQLVQGLDDAGEVVPRIEVASIDHVSGKNSLKISKNADSVKAMPKFVLGAIPDGYEYLGNLASVIRSKNAGPYEVTFDIMFDSLSTYDLVQSSGVLSVAKVAELYGVDEQSVLAALWWKPALAYKVTLKRPQVSGRFGETDTHGSCQHVRLMHIQVPIGTNGGSGNV